MTPEQFSTAASEVVFMVFVPDRTVHRAHDEREDEAVITLLFLSSARSVTDEVTCVDTLKSYLACVLLNFKSRYKSGL